MLLCLNNVLQMVVPLFNIFFSTKLACFLRSQVVCLRPHCMSEFQLVSGVTATTCKSVEKFSVHIYLDCVPSDLSVTAGHSSSLKNHE